MIFFLSCTGQRRNGKGRLPHSFFVNPLSANLIKWSNTLKQFVGNLPANCLSVFDHFVGLALKGLIKKAYSYFIFFFVQVLQNLVNF